MIPDGWGTTAIYVASFIGVVLVLLFCSLLVVNREFNHLDGKAFQESVIKSEFLLIRWPSWWTSEKTGDKLIALFYTTRIKALWVGPLAILQFALGWMVFFTTIIGLTNPSNVVNNNVGSATLFSSELIIHLWYGYFRYWNPSWWCLQIDLSHPSNINFAEARNSCICLYHGNDDVGLSYDLNLVTWIQLLSFVTCLPLYVGSVVGIGVGVAILIVVSYFGRGERIEGAPAIVGVVSAIIGCLTYPILFNVSGIIGKIVASIAHHICLEYYDAQLFNKTEKQFLQSLFFKAFVDFLIAESDVLEGLPPAVELDEKDVTDNNRNESDPDTETGQTNSEEKLKNTSVSDTEHTDSEMDLSVSVDDIADNTNTITRNAENVEAQSGTAVNASSLNDEIDEDANND